MHRRKNFSRGLLNWPECTAENMNADIGFYNSGEGGVEAWLLVPKTYTPENFMGGVRDVCITGFEIGVVWWDALCEPLATMVRDVRNHIYHPRKIMRFTPLLLDGAICIGASGLSPWDCERKTMWIPAYSDLTDEGKVLYKTIRDLYECEPVISLVLDT